MLPKQSLEESLTLDNYFQISKRQAIHNKKERKESEHKRARKDSTQLSLASWLAKTHPSQSSLILTLDKYLMLKVFSYLRISELVAASKVCSFFFSCYRALWNDKEFFCQLETDKLTSSELGRLIEKSTRLDHIRQLKNLYSGKNINYCREKIKLKIGQGNQNTGGMLQIFSVTPKTGVRGGSTFILDSHLLQIVNSSFRSLRVVELVRCSLITNFVCLSRCSELVKLTITLNENFKNEDLGMICKCCKELQQIHFEDCRRLDQNIFQHLQFVEQLSHLTIRNFKQSFVKLRKLENNQFLTYLDLQGSMITDIQAFQLTKLPSLTHLSVKNCFLLTDSFIEHIFLKLDKTSLSAINLQNCTFSGDKVQLLLSKMQQNMI